MTILLDGNDIVVEDGATFDNDRLIISFSARNNNVKNMNVAAQDIKSPGKAFFEKRDMNAIMISARWNHWWQTAEMDAAIEILRARGIFDRYSEIITYGMSMGGYGALMYSSKFRASKVLSIGPQYSLDPRLVPWEPRWHEDQKKIDFIYDDMDVGLIKHGPVHIYYDPFFEKDRMHVDLVKKHRDITPFKVPFATHTVGRMLEEVGIFSKLIAASLREDSDFKPFRQQFRAKRSDSFIYHINLARVLNRKKKAAQSLVMAMRAAEILRGRLSRDPNAFDSPVQAVFAIGTVATTVGNLLDAKRHDDALDLTTFWLGALPRNRSDILLLQARTYLSAGRTDEGWAAFDAASAAASKRRAIDLGSALAVLRHFGSAEQFTRFFKRWSAPILASDNFSILYGEVALRLGVNQLAEDCFWLGLRGAGGPRLVERRRAGLAALGRTDLVQKLQQEPGALDQANLLRKARHNPRQDLANAILAQLVEAVKSGDQDRLMTVHREHGDYIIRNELMALRFAGGLLRHDLTALAIAYLRREGCDNGVRNETTFERRLKHLWELDAHKLAADLLDEARPSLTSTAGQALLGQWQDIMQGVHALTSPLTRTAP